MPIPKKPINNDSKIDQKSSNENDSEVLKSVDESSESEGSTIADVETEESESQEDKKTSKKKMAFIDPKKKRLRPFGERSKASASKKRKLKTSHFDPRKNKESRANLVRRTVILMVLALLGTGVYQAVFPEEPLTPQEVAQISAQQAGITKYPLDDAKGFAQDFIKSYLTVNNSDEADRILNYYYTGEFSESSGGGDKTRSASSSFNQKIITGPTVYKAESLTDNSGSFVIGAVTQPALIKDGKVVPPPADGSNAKLTFFNVNVYWNSKTDSFAITPESPTVVPANEVESSADVPPSQELGTGSSNTELNASVDSIVKGFIKGYAVSSSSDYSAIEQYIISNPPSDLKKGLDGRYSIPNPDQAITFKAYPVEESTEVKVEVTVQWEENVGNDKGEGEGRISYTSTYVMTLNKAGNNKYLVSKFAPLYYVQGTE